MQLGSLVTTNGDAVSHLTLGMAVLLVDCNSKEARKWASTTACAMCETESVAAAQTRAPALASYPTRRDYAQLLTFRDHCEKLISCVLFASVLKSRGPISSRTGWRVNLLTACVAVLLTLVCDAA